MILRPYQIDAVGATLAAFETYRSVLGVAATGLGKTVIFAHVADRRRQSSGGRTLVLAHRKELIWQAASKIQAVTALDPEIEMGEHKADTHIFRRTPFVVSTVQTQVAGKSGGRMNRFDPKEFSLLIIDEAHRSTADTYRRIIDYYREGNPDIATFGVTATPSRFEGKGMATVFDYCAFNFDLPFGVNESWLVPIRQRAVIIEGLDFSGVRSVAGDLSGAELEAAMTEESPLHGVVDATIREAGQSRTLVFAAGVRHAKLLADIFNRRDPGSARWIAGEMDDDVRRHTLSEFALGRFPRLLNVDIAIEGFDDPGIQTVVVARPTESTQRYTQMIGRGTRPLPGVVDGPNAGTAAERSAAIAASSKPHLLVLDFAGNAGQHKLVTSADILGAAEPREVRERAGKLSQGEAIDTSVAILRAKREIADERRLAEEAALQRRRNLIGNITQYNVRDIDPFAVFDIAASPSQSTSQGKPPTDGQIAQLERFGIPTAGLNRRRAAALLGEALRRERDGLASYTQIGTLAVMGMDARQWSAEQARREIGLRLRSRPTVAHAGAMA